MPLLTDYFDRMYIVNLRERKDRRKAIARELKTLHLSFGDSKVEIFAAIQVSEALGFPTPATRGCFESHLAILKEARRRQLNNVLIAEDDLNVSPLLPLHLEGIFGMLNSVAWGMMYLGHVEDLPSSGIPRLIPYAKPLLTTHFYALNGVIFDRLIDCLEQIRSRKPGDPKGGPMHYDGALSTFRAQNPDVCTLIAQPNLGYQRSSRSDIHPHWYEKVTGLRESADLARLFHRQIGALKSALRRKNPLASPPAFSAPLPEAKTQEVLEPAAWEESSRQ